MVAVEIADLEVRRVDGLAEDAQAASRVAGASRDQEALPHVAADDLDRAVAGEVQRAHVRDGRQWRSVDGRVIMDGEPAGVGCRPGRGRRQLVGRVLVVVAPDAQQVVGEQHHPRGRADRADRLGAALADEHHPRNFSAPRTARKDIGRRHRVADAAGDLHVGFAGDRRHRGRLRRLARIVGDADGRRCGPEADGREPRGGRHPPAASHRELPGAMMRRFSHTSTQSAGFDANRKLPVTMSMSPS